MTRKLVVVVAMIGAVLLLAPPASAKGISWARFTGPGLPSGGVTIRGDTEVLAQTGLLQPKSPSFSVYGLTRADLGQPFKAEYRMDYAPRVTLNQVIYPYAKGGMMTFTPRGQHIGQDYESFRGGWKRGSPALLAFLVAHGFPPKEGSETAKPVAAAAPAAQGIGADGSGSAWIWGLVAAAAAVVAVSAAVFVKRRIRRVPG